MSPDATITLFQYGLAGVVIFALAGVVVFLYKELKEERTKNEVLQDKRLQDALAINDRVTGPLREQRELSQKIYDVVAILVNRQNGGDR